MNSTSKLGISQQSPSSAGRRRAAKDIAFLKNNPRSSTTKDYISNKKTVVAEPAFERKSRNEAVQVSRTQEKNTSPFTLAGMGHSMLGKEMHMTQ